MTKEDLLDHATAWRYAADTWSGHPQLCIAVSEGYARLACEKVEADKDLLASADRAIALCDSVKASNEKTEELLRQVDRLGR